MQSYRAYLHPVGCPKANVDREKAGWLLERNGFEIVSEPAGATVALVFGCGFIDDAKRESIADVLGLVDLKRNSGLGHLVVSGCLPQKYARSLSRSIPEVDAWVGNRCLSLLPAICRKVCQEKPGRTIWTEGGSCDWDQIECRRVASCRPWTRTVMISDGCDNGCTYCSIPHMRGALRSRDIRCILDEIGALIQQGAREIVLAGQDTASYGRDWGRPQLAELLSRIATEQPATWIRLSYANPDHLDDGVAQVVAENPNVCNYLDIPIQHASPRILEAMGRRADVEALRSKIDGLRRVVPDIALRTSVIVGFPGETEKDVEQLLAFLEWADFDLVGVFPFSPQPGTPASRLRGKVPDQTAQDRLVDVLSLQNQISQRRMERLLGRQLEILVEKSRQEEGCGRSQYDMAEIDRTIRLRPCRALPGTFVTARLQAITAPYEWTAIPFT